MPVGDDGFRGLQSALDDRFQPGRRDLRHHRLPDELDPAGVARPHRRRPALLHPDLAPRRRPDSGLDARRRRLVRQDALRIAAARDALSEVQRHGVREGDRHPRRLVRFRLLLGGGARQQRLAGPAVSRRSVPGGIRPAPRLVQLVTHHFRRQSRRVAVPRLPHPRLRGGRGRAQDEQVARQLRRPAADHQEVRRRDRPAVGGGERLPGRGAPLAADPGDAQRGLPQDPQYPALLPLPALRLRPGARRGGTGSPGADRPLGALAPGAIPCRSRQYRSLDRCVWESPTSHHAAARGQANRHPSC